MHRMFLLLALSAWNFTRAAEPFPIRGYYVTFMRMPVMGLPEWKQAIDCFAEDDINTLILWTAGGFRSRKFPITWQYNQEHSNVTNDFVRPLIDYAHSKKIRVLLSFTPFGYDGVNQYPIEHPELKAKKADGSPVDEFGIHSWGWNLCPAQEESQRFMREYISEMMFDFYPNADGMMIESSDYNICRCPQCGPKFYDREFAFVKWISDEVWKRNANATILVYPHYFTGAKVPGLEATAAREPFDARWGLFFTPHSAHFDDALIRRAHESVFWSDAPILGTPVGVLQAAHSAREHHVTGFMPSMEAYSYVTQHIEGEPSQRGLRKKAFGFDTLTDARMPYTNLLARVQRFAFREASHDPELSQEELKRRVGKKFFGDAANDKKIADLLELQRIFAYESEWYWPSPLLDPDFFRAHAKRLNWPETKLAEYRANLGKLRDIASNYADSKIEAGREMARISQAVVDRWANTNP